jgi:hypothetical protein
VIEYQYIADDGRAHSHPRAARGSVKNAQRHAPHSAEVSGGQLFNERCIQRLIARPLSARYLNALFRPQAAISLKAHDMRFAKAHALAVLPHELSINHRRKYLRFRNLHRIDLEDVAIENDEVRQFAGRQRSLASFVV